MRGDLHPFRVRAHQPVTQAAPPLDAGIAQIGSVGHVPRNVHEAAGLPVETGRQIRAGGPQAVPQRPRLLGRHGHSLGVERVEAAYRVTDDEESGGRILHPLVVSPQRTGETVGHRVAQRLGRRDQVVDVGYGQGSGERLESLGIRRRMVTEHSGERDVPAAALQRDGTAATESGHGRDYDRTLTVEMLGTVPVETRRVSEIHVGPPLGRGGQFQGGQPVRAAGGPAGRVHHQVRVDNSDTDTAGLPGDMHPDDPVGRLRRGDQPGRGRPLDELHAGDRPQPRPQDVLQQPPAGKHRGQPGRGRANPQPPQVPAGTHQRLDRGRAPLGELRGQPGEQLLHDLASAVEQPVQVPALGHATAGVAVGTAVEEHVPFQHRDPLEGLREHPGGQQPGHAGAEDDRVATAVFGRPRM